MEVNPTNLPQVVKLDLIKTYGRESGKINALDLTVLCSTL